MAASENRSNAILDGLEDLRCVINYLAGHMMPSFCIFLFLVHVVVFIELFRESDVLYLRFVYNCIAYIPNRVTNMIDTVAGLDEVITQGILPFHLYVPMFQCNNYGRVIYAIAGLGSQTFTSLCAELASELVHHCGTVAH